MKVLTVLLLQRTHVTSHLHSFLQASQTQMHPKFGSRRKPSTSNQQRKEKKSEASFDEKRYILVRN